ncbi:hypothetical protein SAMD00019534_052540, partial [Acytostelium subglobosum LB1]|uniref:hypothetical protein n=1 Tax=Acytostelium subglobosum LB1 TaxID=1410327 RepID=UPI00064501BE
MATLPQSGILIEHCKFAIVIEAMVCAEQHGALKMACGTFAKTLEDMQRTYPNDKLGSVVAFGHNLWKSIGCKGGPDLKNFEPMGVAPATQRDLLIHIQSLRHDINFTLAQHAIRAFGNAIKVQEETHAFRWVEERDLSGFIDGTENPKGAKVAKVALVSKEDDPDSECGSYVLVQKWEHNLVEWAMYPEQQQERMIGRTKKDSVELDDDKRNETSHVARVDLKENGQGLKILRHSLPYGTVSGKHGLFFIAYSGRLYNIERQLQSMFGQLEDGKTDDILKLSTPVSGGYYFAPSISKLASI